MFNLLTVVLFSNTEVGWDGRNIQHVQEMKHLLHITFLSKVSTVSDQAEHLDVEGGWLYITADDEKQSPSEV